jgi:hypothetical protein
MMSRVRLYLKFDDEWVESVPTLEDILIHVIQLGLLSYGEVCNSYDYKDGAAFLELISENRDGDVLRDIVFETLVNHFDTLHEAYLEVDIDLDVEYGVEIDT